MSSGIRSSLSNRAKLWSKDTSSGSIAAHRDCTLYTYTVFLWYVNHIMCMNLNVYKHRPSITLSHFRFYSSFFHPSLSSHPSPPSPLSPPIPPSLPPSLLDPSPPSPLSPPIPPSPPHSLKLTNIEEFPWTVDAELGVLEDQRDVHLTMSRADWSLHCYCIRTEDLNR